MENNIKKISVNAFEPHANNRYTIQWNELDVEIKRFLSLHEMMGFVDNVVECCFSDDTNYLPEIKEFIIKYYLLDTYTNIALPSDVNAAYDFIYQSDITDIILDSIDRKQFSEMLKAIDKKIDSILQENISVVNKQINEIMAFVENLKDRFAEVFSGVDKDDISKLIGTITDGKFDPSKLVDAYFNKMRQNNISESTSNNVTD